jgi:SAM-dependent methyltransferase
MAGRELGSWVLERREKVMPSSDPKTIPVVMRLVDVIKPKSVLDVGCGNGRYGFLFREMLDWNYGNIHKCSWKTRLDCVEVERDYITPIHSYIYDNVYVQDWDSVELENPYDVIFMGDVLEHFKDWKSALEKSNEYSTYTIVACPNWEGSINQKEWHGYSSEVHQCVLSPCQIGGKCVFANSKAFISVFDNSGTGMMDDPSIVL